MGDARTISISETFTSRQGEGKLTGTPTYFIRTNGCNLRCWYCDTPYASWNPTGKSQSIDQVLEDAVDSGLAHVVLTGGEPLLPQSIQTLCDSLMASGLHLTIETAGSIDRPIQCDLLSLSPKLADSAPDAKQHPRWNRLHHERRLPINTMKRLIDAAKEYQVKFVVSSPAQYSEVEQLAEQLASDPQDVFIMPQGTTIDEMDEAMAWLRPWCESVGFQYCDRMQIRWYGNRRGT